jgi:hypothetical protein
MGWRKIAGVQGVAALREADQVMRGSRESV